MRRVLATMLEQLESPTEMSAWIDIQSKPTSDKRCLYRPKVKVDKHKDGGKKESNNGGENESDKGEEGNGRTEANDNTKAKNEKEGYNLIGQLTASITKLKALHYSNEGNDENQHCRKRQRIQQPTNVQLSDPSQTSNIVNSHYYGRLASFLQQCLG